ncbi:hypothetical protein [Bacillus sp. PS06]|uniref:hypothetical protein n=1 Tax=Bacillus sp. PS06 TaxID=2764176 RepID=UPI00177AA60B|nr:hypothetical protein [Bacillus sp. PS06]MBD8068781.1 hypothetical protein [Bacillus sp. PS06]
MTIIWIALVSLVATFLFDFIIFKIEHERAVEKSWQELNDRLEKEGRPRLDKKKKKRGK